MSYTNRMITSGTEWGQATNRRIAFIEHIPPPNPNGNKHQIFISLHGAEANGSLPTSDTDFDTLAVVANKSVPLLIRDVGATIPLFQKPGSFTGDTYGTIVLAPQSLTSEGTTPFAYPGEMIKYAYNNLGSVANLDIITLFGYSKGAGCVISCIKDPKIAPYISRAVAVAPGYSAAPDYVTVANVGPPLFEYHVATDPTAVVGWSDNYVRNLNLQSPVNPCQYRRFSGASVGTENHDDIIATITTTTPEGSYQLSNGDIWTQVETEYQMSLRFTIHRQKRAA